MVRGIPVLPLKWKKKLNTESMKQNKSNGVQYALFTYIIFRFTTYDCRYVISIIQGVYGYSQKNLLLWQICLSLSLISLCFQLECVEFSSEILKKIRD